MPSIEEFLTHLDLIPWFASRGKPADRDQDVFRIFHWHAWPWPEDPGSDLLCAFHRYWKDALLDSEELRSRFLEPWQTIKQKALEILKQRVPFDEKKDVWYGPNAAVKQAASVAALVGCMNPKRGILQPEGKPTLQWTLGNPAK